MYEIEETFEKLMRWATNLSEFLATDKSNDWTEELRELEEILEIDI